MRVVKVLVFLFIAVLLSACGPKNPLIGTWELSDTEAGTTGIALGMGGNMAPIQKLGAKLGAIEFTSSSIKQLAGNIEVQVKAYKVEGDKVGVVGELLGQETTVWYQIVDENTIATDAGMLKLTYRRVGSTPKPTNANSSEGQAAAKVEQHALPQADAKTPLENYVPIADGNDMMYAFYALSAASIPYESIAEHTSSDYRFTTDVFKKQDILKQIQSSIDNKVAEKKGRYFMYELNGVTLGHYDLATHAFPINAFSNERIYYFESNPDFKLVFTNSEAFNQLKVEDANSARALEDMVSQAKLSNRVKLYIYAQEPDLQEQRIKAQIVNMIIFDRLGNQIVKFRQ